MDISSIAMYAYSRLQKLEVTSDSVRRAARIRVEMDRILAE